MVYGKDDGQPRWSGLFLQDHFAVSKSRMFQLDNKNHHLRMDKSSGSKLEHEQCIMTHNDVTYGLSMLIDMLVCTELCMICVLCCSKYIHLIYLKVFFLHFNSRCF